MLQFKNHKTDHKHTSYHVPTPTCFGTYVPRLSTTWFCRYNKYFMYYSP